MEALGRKDGVLEKTLHFYLAQRYDLEVSGRWSWCLSVFSSGVPVCTSCGR
jgi:hypothetical protein